MNSTLFPFLKKNIFIDFSIFLHTVHSYFFTYVHLHSLKCLCVFSSHVQLSSEMWVAVISSRRFLSFYSILYPIWRLLHSTLFPVDVLSRSAFITFLCPFVIIYHSTFCPFDVFYYSMFFPSTFCLNRRFVRRHILPSAFFTSTFCRWIKTETNGLCCFLKRG
jgi:hypothetical protein